MAERPAVAGHIHGDGNQTDDGQHEAELEGGELPFANGHGRPRSQLHRRRTLWLLPLAYMSLCTYSSLFKLRLFGTYSLHGGRQSAPGALLFNSMYLIRLQFPLGYNYLRILRYDAAEGCAFKQLMSSTMRSAMEAFQLALETDGRLPRAANDASGIEQ